MKKRNPAVAINKDIKRLRQHDWASSTQQVVHNSTTTSVPERHWKTTHSLRLLGCCINRWHKYVWHQPLVVVLNNARIYKAQVIELQFNWLQEPSVTLYFLPTHNTELNLIDVLSNTVKDRWLEVRHCTKQA